MDQIWRKIFPLNIYKLKNQCASQFMHKRKSSDIKPIKPISYAILKIHTQPHINYPT